MTKAAEIKLLDDTIKRFGPHSYLGPWLAEIRDELVADINNDLTPTAMLPRAARQYAAGFMETTKAEAQKLRDAADAYAKGEREKAYKDAADIRRAARLELERLAAKL